MTLSPGATPGPDAAVGLDAAVGHGPGPFSPGATPGIDPTVDHGPGPFSPGATPGIDPTLSPRAAPCTAVVSPGTGAPPRGTGAPPDTAASPGSPRGTVAESRASPRPRAVRPRSVPARSRLIRELPPEERPRERLVARGAAGLSNPELLALIWGSGGVGRSAVEIASEAVALHGGLAGLATASVVELERIPGVGAARACQLVAAFELGRRLLADWPSGRITVRTPRDVADRLVLQMGRLDREELRVVLLNTKNQVLGIQTVYQGNVSTALVRVGELFRDAVRQAAAGMILVHNHPSGDPTPSPDDLHLTAEAVAAGRILDVPVLDHLVIGHDAFVSLRDRGVAFERPGGGG